jgi:hypothetical protein
VPPFPLGLLGLLGLLLSLNEGAPALPPRLAAVAVAAVEAAAAAGLRGVSGGERGELGLAVAVGSQATLIEGLRANSARSLKRNSGTVSAIEAAAATTGGTLGVGACVGFGGGVALSSSSLSMPAPSIASSSAKHSPTGDSAKISDSLRCAQKA